MAGPRDSGCFPSAESQAGPPVHHRRPVHEQKWSQCEKSIYELTKIVMERYFIAFGRGYLRSWQCGRNTGNTGGEIIREFRPDDVTQSSPLEPPS